MAMPCRARAREHPTMKTPRRTAQVGRISARSSGEAVRYPLASQATTRPDEGRRHVHDAEREIREGADHDRGRYPHSAIPNMPLKG
jgi:hypothetical protein